MLGLTAEGQSVGSNEGRLTLKAMVSVSLPAARTAPAAKRSVRNAPAPSARVWRRVTSTMHDLPIHPSHRSHVPRLRILRATLSRPLIATLPKWNSRGKAWDTQLYEAEFICACAIHWLARAFSVSTAFSLTPHEPLNMLMQINNRPEGARRWRRGP